MRRKNFRGIRKNIAARARLLQIRRNRRAGLSPTNLNTACIRVGRSAAPGAIEYLLLPETHLLVYAAIIPSKLLLRFSLRLLELPTMDSMMLNWSI
jgi:hypothetical protein